MISFVILPFSIKGDTCRISELLFSRLSAESSHSWKSPNKILLNSPVMLSDSVYTREGIRDGERSRRMAAVSLCPVVAPKSPLSSRSPDGPLPGPALLRETHTL